MRCGLSFYVSTRNVRDCWVHTASFRSTVLFHAGWLRSAEQAPSTAGSDCSSGHGTNGQLQRRIAWYSSKSVVNALCKQLSLASLVAYQISSWCQADPRFRTSSKIIYHFFLTQSVRRRDNRSVFYRQNIMDKKEKYNSLPSTSYPSSQRVYCILYISFGHEISLISASVSLLSVRPHLVLVLTRYLSPLSANFNNDRRRRPKKKAWES